MVSIVKGRKEALTSSRNFINCIVRARAGEEKGEEKVEEILKKQTNNRNIEEKRSTCAEQN